MKDIDLNVDDYVYWGQWKQPVLSCWFWINWQETDSMKKVNTHNIILHPLIYLDGHFWVHKTHYLSLSKMMENIIDNNLSSEYLSKLTAVLTEYENKYISLLSKYKENPNEYIRHLFSLSSEVYSLWLWVTFLAEEIAKILIKRKIVDSESDLIEKSHNSSLKTWLEKQNIEVFELSKLVRFKGMDSISLSLLNTDLELKNRFDSHVKEFSWFGTHHWIGEGYTLESCIDQVNALLKLPGKDFITKENTKVSEMINLVQTGIYWRTHCAEITAKVVYESRGIISDLGLPLRIPYNDLVYLTDSEFLSLNKNSNVEEIKNIISERKKGYGLLVIDGQVQIITGDPLQNLLSKMLNRNQNKVTEFKGSIASKSPLTRGLVKIIISPEDFYKFKDNDILVVPETTPDYVLLMKKSSAIITDAGGVTSHAAIVARELKKPCIIGTKIATQVLKDGDFVEIDTDKGLVRIINDDVF